MQSGAIFTVFDACGMSNLFLSAGSTVIGITYGNSNDTPTTLTYDVALHSGLVLVSSGQVFLTATYK